MCYILQANGSKESWLTRERFWYLSSMAPESPKALSCLCRQRLAVCSAQMAVTATDHPSLIRDQRSALSSFRSKIKDQRLTSCSGAVLDEHGSDVSEHVELSILSYELDVSCKRQAISVDRQGIRTLHQCCYRNYASMANLFSSFSAVVSEFVTTLDVTRTAPPHTAPRGSRMIFGNYTNCSLTLSSLCD